MVSFIRLSRSSVVHDNGLLVHGDNGGGSSSAGSARGGDSSLGGTSSSTNKSESEGAGSLISTLGLLVGTNKFDSEGMGSLVGTSNSEFDGSESSKESRSPFVVFGSV